MEKGPLSGFGVGHCRKCEGHWLYHESHSFWKDHLCTGCYLRFWKWVLDNGIPLSQPAMTNWGSPEQLVAIDQWLSTVA